MDEELNDCAADELELNVLLEMIELDETTPTEPVDELEFVCAYEPTAKTAMRVANIVRKAIMVRIVLID